MKTQSGPQRLPSAVLIMSSTCIFNRQCGTLPNAHCKFSTTKSYFAVAQIVILLCIKLCWKQIGKQKVEYLSSTFKGILCDFFILTLEQIIVLNKCQTLQNLCKMRYK